MCIYFLKIAARVREQMGKILLPITAFDCRVRSLIEWKDANEIE